MGLVPAIFCFQISSPRSPLGLVPFTKNRPLGLVPDVDREYKNKVGIMEHLTILYQSKCGKFSIFVFVFFGFRFWLCLNDQLEEFIEL